MISPNFFYIFLFLIFNIYLVDMLSVGLVNIFMFFSNLF